MIGKRNILLKDNTSAILLELRKQSSTKQTRHLSIKYHYVTSKLNNKTITVVTYQPTNKMVADYLSKPLQGSLFRKHWNSILGITEQDEVEALEKYQKRLQKWIGKLHYICLVCWYFNFMYMYMFVPFNTQQCKEWVWKWKNSAAEPRGDTTRPLLWTIAQGLI